MSESRARSVTVAKHRFELRRDEVEWLARQTLPEPIASHYVVIGDRRYPPKQVIGLVTGLDRADFTSHQSRRILMGLGFPVGRRRGGSSRSKSDAGAMFGPLAGAGSEAMRSAPTASFASEKDELADALRPFRGQWVAIKAEELLVAAVTPGEVVAWLATHGQRADSMFRVPEDELALGGLAPL